MNSQIATRCEAAKNRAWNLAEPGLNRRSVPNPSRDMHGDRVGDRILFRRGKAQQFLLVFDDGGQLGIGNASVPMREWHQGIEMSDPHRNLRPKFGKEIDERT